MSVDTAAQQLTSEQSDALAAHDRTVSLAAGAGCGKTYVLTERFLSYLDPRQLEPKADLRELVAITFTDAAAREMRNRIRLRCYARLEEATNVEERAAWQRLIRALDGAQISTIHAFCSALLREHAVEAELDPRFEVLDPPAAELLRLQTLDDRLREMLLVGEGRVMRLATRLGLRQLRDAVADLIGKHVQPVIDQWLGKSPEELAEAWRQFYAQTVVPQSAAALLDSGPIADFRELCLNAEVNRPGFAEHVDRVMQTLQQLAEGDAPAAAQELQQLARVQGVCTEKDWDDAQAYQQFKNTCEAVRNLLKKSLLTKPLQESHLLEAAATGLDLLEVVADVAQRYADVKQAENVLEFDDLLICAHRLLTDPQHRGLQQRLMDSIRLLMVDEFQDTDPLQVAIVKAFCGDDWSRQGLFVVGDHKQSIYRFRGAEPRVSSQLRSSLAEAGRLSLTTNFRSQPAILNFVNALFHGAFSEDYQPLRPSRSQSTPTPAVEFIWAVGEGDDRDQELFSRFRGKQRARAREAHFVARRLAQLIDSRQPIIDATEDAETEAQLRPLELGDIAILMRSLVDVAVYEEALRQHGLDYYLAGGHAFYAQQEIYDVLHLLRAIASEADELSLAGALRSPLFSLADETLFWLVQQSGSLGKGLFAAELPPQLPDEERAKAARAANTLRQLREEKDRRSVAGLLNRAWELTGYDAALLCEFLGERKLANVRKLLEQARAIDRVRPGDLAGFITQLSELVVRDPKEALATTRAEGNVIRIMTIHHAKGLEFPLVVLPDLERGTRGTSTGPVFDPQLGPLVASAEKEDKNVMVGLDLYRAIQRAQDLEERKRLLYVACTRAADYLILSSSVDDLEKPKRDWLKLLAERFDLRSGHCLATLPKEHSAPEVRVMTEAPPLERKLPGKSRGGNLEKVIAKTQQLAAAGQGTVPENLAAIPPDAAARKRFSFSRLSGVLILDRQEPASAGGSVEASSRWDPLGFGTLVHAVLERIDFDADNDVEALCQFLAPLHLQTGWQEAAAEAAELVNRFVQSPRAAELRHAGAIRREVEFVLPWPPTEAPFAGRYLHGYIDCLYQDESGGWHLIDYKSNQISAERVPDAAAPYAMQMYVYAQVCRRALGVEPVECVLHFLRPQEEFVCEFDDASSAELAADVTRAIEEQLQQP